MRKPSNTYVYVSSGTILVAALPLIVGYFTNTLPPVKSVADHPPLTNFRYPDGTFFAAQHTNRDPMMYIVLHAIPACIWVILIPFQLNDGLRRKFPTVHRISGYTTFLISTWLCLTGFIMPSIKLSFTQPFFYFHRWGPLVWPSFQSLADGAGVGMLVTLVPALYYARQRKFDLHRRWATYHSISGFVIPAQRWFMAIPPAFGHFVAWLRKTGRANEELLTRIGLPANMTLKQIAEAEMAGFSLSALLAGVFTAWYLFSLHGSTATVKTGEKGSAAISKKSGLWTGLLQASLLTGATVSLTSVLLANNVSQSS